MNLGHNPAAVIGDLDSLDAETRSALPPGRVHRIADQETTDFDKCLRNIRAPLVLAVGFTGARLDHEMAAFSTLLQHAGRACLLVGEHDVAFVAPFELRLALEPGTRVSLFPMGEVTGESRGLRWPIEGLKFAPGGRIGTSNETVGQEIALRFSARRMLVFLPRAALAAAIRALAPEYAAKAAARGG
jgi:thiamine pyrophosphokinase